MGFDSMSDSHLINDRSLLIPNSIKQFDQPLTINGATGTELYYEYGDVFMDNMLIKDAILCSTFAHNIISAGRLGSDNPSWTWSFDRSPSDVVRVRAHTPSGDSRI